MKSPTAMTIRWLIRSHLSIGRSFLRVRCSAAAALAQTCCLRAAPLRLTLDNALDSWVVVLTERCRPTSKRYAERTVVA